MLVRYKEQKKERERERGGGGDTLSSLVAIRYFSNGLLLLNATACHGLKQPAQTHGTDVNTTQQVYINKGTSSKVVLFQTGNCFTNPGDKRREED